MASAQGSRSGARGFISSAILASALIGCLVVVLATVVHQLHGLISALAGVVLVLAYFVSGQLTEWAAMRLANSQGMVLIMSGYIARVTALGLVLWWAIGNVSVALFVSPMWVGAGALAAVLGWLGGLIIGHSRMRIQVYDRPYVTPEGWDA